MMNRMRFFLLFIITEILMIMLIVLLWMFFDLTLNLTHSFPVGIYQVDKKSAWQKGDLVVVCPENNQQFQINFHNNLSSGKCATGTEPLLKKIAATAGDVVEVKDFVYVNRVIQKNSKVYSKYNGIKKYPCYGKHTIRQNRVWIMSDYNQLSFDSRYFCEVPTSNVIGKAKLLFEF